MLTLFLVRHGETEFNATGRIQGWLDVPLNAMGERQAHLVAERFRDKPIAALYSSSLRRALQTAEAIARTCGLELRPDHRLREYNMGDWSGLTGEEVAAAMSVSFAHFQEQWLQREVTIPNGETAVEVRQRVREFLQDVLLTHTDGNVIAVSHGGTLGALLGEVLGLPISRRHPFRFYNASVSELIYEHHRWHLVRLNDCCHLHQT